MQRPTRIMQRWQWEVCKMFLYMIFPVGCFHYFNSPQIFEEAVTKVKKETFPSTSAETREKIQAILEKLRQIENLKNLEKIESNIPKN